MEKLRLLTQKKLDSIIEARVQEALSQTNRNLERELLMKQADLAALQGQINPHFLYNALECIRGLAFEENADKVASAAHALSQYFRYCISNKSNVVTLKDELNYVQDYVTIQQFRFQDRFVLSVETEEEVPLDVVVPKLMLQPLVENAIVHGFMDKLRDGLIKITVRSLEKHVEITVSDNGKGITPERLKELNDALSTPAAVETTPEEQAGNGVALTNVNNRLKMLFGNTYGLSIFSGGPDNGTAVTVFLPKTYLGIQ